MKIRRSVKVLMCNNQNENENTISDEDFELMKASIDNLIATDPIETSPETLTSLNSPNMLFKSKNVVAILSSLFGGLIFFTQTSQQVSGVALLNQMEKDSVPFKEALCNNKPTVIEFYADWCESCKELAPKFRALEFKFKDDINFVAINGAKRENSNLVNAFRVDGIPHIAFITKDARVETALIGAVPEKYLQENMNSLVKGIALPYEGYDAFEEESHYLYNKEGSFCQASAVEAL